MKERKIPSTSKTLEEGMKVQLLSVCKSQHVLFCTYELETNEDFRIVFTGVRFNTTTQEISDEFRTMGFTYHKQLHVNVESEDEEVTVVLLGESANECSISVQFMLLCF